MAKSVLKPNEEALYHLRKIIGLNKEAQKHIEELRKLGVGMYESDTSIELLWGLEKLGLPIKGESCKHVECCNTRIFQR